MTASLNKGILHFAVIILKSMLLVGFSEINLIPEARDKEQGRLTKKDTVI